MNSTTWQIVDSQTGNPVGKPYTDLHRAHRRADKLDLDYGAVRYIVKRQEPTLASTILAIGPL